MHKTVALGRVVPPKRHLKLENVLLQAIALECGECTQAYPERFL